MKKAKSNIHNIKVGLLVFLVLIMSALVSAVIDVEIDAELDSSTKAFTGKDIIIHTYLKNTGENETNYNVSLWGHEDWAEVISIDPESLTVKENEVGYSEITLKLNKDSQGEKSFAIKASYDGGEKNQFIGISIKEFIDLPDLSISDGYSDPEILFDTSFPVDFYFLTNNTGNESINVSAYAYFADEIITPLNITQFFPFKSGINTWSIRGLGPFAAGKHYLEIGFFPVDDIEESNKINNLYLLEFEVFPTEFLNLTTDIGNDTVWFKNNNRTFIEFDRSDNLINLTGVKVVRQPEESDYAYLVISGLNLTSQNITKTVYLDRIINGTGICIKDEELLSINQISDHCNETNEYWLACPGGDQDYSCSLVENDTRYKVGGLRHSGVKEQEAYCGDGIANGLETCSSCSIDVGGCPNPPHSSGGRRSSVTPASEEVRVLQIVQEVNISEDETDIPEKIIEEIVEEESISSGITGATIGGGDDNKITLSTIFIILIVGSLGVIMLKRRI